MKIQSTQIVVLFALIVTISAVPLWFEVEDQMPMNLRGFRWMPSQADSIDSYHQLPKRASFVKRRGRELFGKRSQLPMDFGGPLEEGMIYENRFRRRANELFG